MSKASETTQITPISKRNPKASGTFAKHTPPPADMEEIGAWVEFFAAEGPAKFLRQRLAWLSDTDAVRLQQVGPESFDIVIRVDGTYLGRENAERMGTFIAEQLAAVAALIKAEARRG